MHRKKKSKKKKKEKGYKGKGSTSTAAGRKKRKEGYYPQASCEKGGDGGLKRQQRDKQGKTLFLPGEAKIKFKGRLTDREKQKGKERDNCPLDKGPACEGGGRRRNQTKENRTDCKEKMKLLRLREEKLIVPTEPFTLGEWVKGKGVSERRMGRKEFSLPGRVAKSRRRESNFS